MYGLHFSGQYGTTAANRIDWASDSIFTALATSSYTPNQDTHDFYDDITNQVANGSGYTTGGFSHGSKTVTYDTASNETRFDADDAVWSSASFTARYSVTFKKVGGSFDTDDPLITYQNFGGDETVSSGTFQIQWAATGVWKITAA